MGASSKEQAGEFALPWYFYNLIIYSNNTKNLPKQN
jgi:hypothetical protein